MKKIHVDQIWENTIWEWLCPTCNKSNETYKKPELEETITCDCCAENFELTDEDAND